MGGRRPERGIPYSMDQTDAYLGSWIKALKDDKHALFRAAADASKATDYLLAFEKGKTEEQTVEQPLHVERLEEQRASQHPRRYEPARVRYNAAANVPNGEERGTQ